MARIPRKLAGIGATDIPDTVAFDAYIGPARELTVDHVRGILSLHDGVTQGGFKFFNNSQNIFNDFEDFSENSGDRYFDENTLITIDGLLYLRKEAETIVGLPAGWIPFGIVTANHFGAVRGRTVPAQNAFKAAAAYLNSIGGGVLTALSGEYLFTEEWTLPCGVDLIDHYGRIDFVEKQPIRPLNADQTVSSYTGQVASRCRFPENVSTVTKTMARSTHVAKETLSSLRIVIPAAYVYTGTVQETPAGGDLTVTASIEYPLGTLTQVKFSGVAAGTVTDGTLLISDPVAVSIPEGKTFWVRQFLSGPYIPYQFSENPVTGSRGDAYYNSASATDQTMDSGAVLVEHATSLITPAAIIGTTTKRSYALIGDSRVRGYLDTQPTAQGVGEFEPNMRGAGHLNIAYNGSKASDFLSSNTLRSQLVGYCTDIIVGYGINDLASGVSAATIRSNIEAIAALYPSKRAHVGTVCPRSASTDNWVTVGGQSPFAQEAERQALNASIRAGLTGFYSFVDTAAAVEDRDTPGVWRANLTDDGIHANGAGYREMKVSNIMTGGLSCVYVSTGDDRVALYSRISGIRFLTKDGDGGNAISTQQRNAAFYSSGAHVIVEGCFFGDADAANTYPSAPENLAAWGWGRALNLAHSNGSAFRDNDVVGAFDPTTSANLQSHNVGVELATDGTSGIIATDISMNRLWYCQTALYVGEDVLAFWFTKNECIKCFQGVYAPADALEDGVALAADTRITENYITVCATAINLINRQMLHIIENHTNSDASYYDAGAGFTGIRLEGASKFKVRGNSANLASGHAAWAGVHRAVVLSGCTGGSVESQQVSRYFHEGVYLNGSNYQSITGVDGTQVTDALVAFVGTCRNVQVSGLNPVTAPPTTLLKFYDASTTISNFGTLIDNFVLPVQATSLTVTGNNVSVDRRNHIINTLSAAQTLHTATGPNVRDGVRLTLRASSSSYALTVVDGAGGVGQFLLAGNWVSTNARDYLEVEYSNAFSAWIEVSRSINGA